MEFALQLQLLEQNGSFMAPLVEVSCGCGLSALCHMDQSGAPLCVCLPCLAQEGLEVQQLREDFADLQSECAMLRAAVEEKEEMIRQLKADILRLDYKTETERV